MRGLDRITILREGVYLSSDIIAWLREAVNVTCVDVITQNVITDSLKMKLRKRKRKRKETMN